MITLFPDCTDLESKIGGVFREILQEVLSTFFWEGDEEPARCLGISRHDFPMLGKVVREFDVRRDKVEITFTAAGNHIFQRH